MDYQVLVEMLIALPNRLYFTSYKSALKTIRIRITKPFTVSVRIIISELAADKSDLPKKQLKIIIVMNFLAFSCSAIMRSISVKIVALSNLSTIAGLSLSL